jgi:hypothetical protein
LSCSSVPPLVLVVGQRERATTMMLPINIIAVDRGPAGALCEARLSGLDIPPEACGDRGAREAARAIAGMVVSQGFNRRPINLSDCVSGLGRLRKRGTQDLYRFGPPESNTLRPVRAAVLFVLICSRCYKWARGSSVPCLCNERAIDGWR